jgi:hypothetical protein
MMDVIGSWFAATSPFTSPLRSTLCAISKLTRRRFSCSILANSSPLACPESVLKAELRPTDKDMPVTLHKVVAKAAAASSGAPMPPTKRNEISQGIFVKTML